MHLSTNRLTAMIVGALWLIAGVAGFFVTAGVGFFSSSGGLLVGLFAVNPAANTLAIVLGAVLVLASLSTKTAKTAAIVVGTACLVLSVVGLFVVGTDLNVFALNGADNVVHSANAVLLLAVGLGADRPTKPAAKDPVTRNDPRS